MGLKYNSNTCTRWDSSNVRGHNSNASKVYDQQGGLSAKDKIFIPGGTVRQYRPKDPGAAKLSQLRQGLNQHLSGAQRDLLTLRNGMYSDCGHWK